MYKGNSNNITPPEIHALPSDQGQAGIEGHANEVRAHTGHDDVIVDVDADGSRVSSSEC